MFFWVHEIYTFLHMGFYLNYGDLIELYKKTKNKAGIT